MEMPRRCFICAHILGSQILSPHNTHSILLCLWVKSVCICWPWSHFEGHCFCLCPWCEWQCSDKAFKQLSLLGISKCISSPSWGYQSVSASTSYCTLYLALCLPRDFCHWFDHLASHFGLPCLSDLIHPIHLLDRDLSVFALFFCSKRVSTRGTKTPVTTNLT